MKEAEEWAPRRRPCSPSLRCGRRHGPALQAVRPLPECLEYSGPGAVDVVIGPDRDLWQTQRSEAVRVTFSLLATPPHPPARARVPNLSDKPPQKRSKGQKGERCCRLSCHSVTRSGMLSKRPGGLRRLAFKFSFKLFFCHKPRPKHLRCYRVQRHPGSHPEKSFCMVPV